MAPDREEPTNYELYRLIEDVKKTTDEIRIDVKAQNSKVAKHEAQIAVLEDRGARDDGARWGALGAFVTGVIGTAVHFLFRK